MLTKVDFRGLTEQDLNNLKSITGLVVETVPITRGFYKATVSYTPSKLDLVSKELFSIFIKDAIYSHHQ
jgi:hypothetical protein